MKHQSTKRIDATKALLELKYPKNLMKNELSSARENAKERFIQLGCPLPNDEYWKFSSPQRFTSLNLESEREHLTFQLPKDQKTDEIRLTFVDGTLNRESSDLMNLPSSIEIFFMKDGNVSQEKWIKDLYGTIESESQKSIKRPLAALNTACASDGVFIRVKGNTAKKIVIDYVSRKPNSDSIIHNLVKVEKGSNLSLIETGEGCRRSSYSWC